MSEKKIVNNQVIILISLVILIAIYSCYFSGFLLNQNYLLGDDYSYFLPSLLNGYFWLLSNGILEVPWFTAAFCGGIPYFPNPQVMYYSVPQILTFIFDPLFSVYLTFIIFAVLGYIGFFMLSYKVFDLKIEVSIFAATLFLFNGFYLNRIVLGHFTVHSFMLVPLVAYFLLHHDKSSNSKIKFNSVFDVIIAGMLLAYMFHSGAANYLVPFVISVIGIWLMLDLSGNVKTQFWPRLICAGVVAIALSASKLFSAIEFMKNFPRDFNLLPGIEGFWNTLLFVIQALFFSVTEESINLIVNNSFSLESRGFAFGITVVPLAMCLIVGLLKLKGYKKNKSILGKSFSLRKLLVITSFLFIIFLPVFLNVYTPSWNNFLKDIPYIKNSSLLTRWIVLDIPLLILLAALVVNSVTKNVLRAVMCFTGVIIVIMINHNNAYKTDANLNYDSRNIINAYYQAKLKGVPPEIKHIGLHTDKQSRIILAMGRNDSLTRGVSELFCYEPIFGYSAEKLPVKTLHPGSVFEQSGNFLNIKNPACYLYPEHNYCEPGDHYNIEEVNKAEKLVRYEPVEFDMSFAQRLVNWINIISIYLFLLIIFLAIFLKFFYISKNK